MLRLCRIDEIDDGAARSFSLQEPSCKSVFAVRRGHSVVVYRDSCPHENTPMAWRRDEYLNVERTRIVCFAHGAEFEIETGLCLIGPCIGQYLTRVPSAIDEQGWIIIDRTGG